MKCLEVTEREDGYDARLIEVEEPRCKHGETLVRVTASGVNRADLSQIAGKYPPPPGESQILGLEVSGTVAGTGQRVCALLAGGGHAELAAVPTGQLFPAPRCMSLVHAAAIPEAFLTAFTNLVVEAKLARGQTLLVHAGASGVGLAAIGLGKLLGVRVAATTRTKQKIGALTDAGADLAIDTSAEDFAAAIESRWGPAAVHVILDPVGAATLAGNLRILATGGRVISLATMSGARVELDLRALMARRARLIGSMLRGRSRPEKAALVERFQKEVLPAFDGGGLRIAIDSVYPPEEAAAAFTRMRENRNVGKILIDWMRPG
ncbi:MAG TPA: NAD(P)H-quinone oxidoreductase [Thermoanaerobaculia bacterium]|nr:NAD(P)H-quinone oxidoreductase [Thermoanaerobaculia bacterium]